MRKLFSFNLITLDGFFEGPQQDISWHNVDEEFNEFAIEQLDTADCRPRRGRSDQAKAAIRQRPCNLWQC